MKHFNLKITGKVQGVWYRGSTLRKAEELGLKGFVRNQSDGSVHIELEGEEAACQALIRWCRKGPPMARVARVKVEESELKNFEQFEILR